MLQLGVIADDFTGAGDAASFIAAAGMRTVLLNGLPCAAQPIEAEAAVIALKTRTQEKSSAVADSLAAAAWLKANGARRLYFKYCSTFDSTREGNIGPTLDALLEAYDIPYTLLCPALPVNGRTVTGGKLYVNGVPLDESPMRDHPLTPMWDADIAKLMEPQSSFPCIKIGRLYQTNPQAAREMILKFGQNHPHFYVIPDYEQSEDAFAIAKCFEELPLFSGGSGLLEVLADKGTGARQPLQTAAEGAALVLAGSCSAATRRQIASLQETGYPSLHIDALALLSGRQTLLQLKEFICSNPNGALIYSSDDPAAVQRIQAEGSEKISAMLEGAMAELAVYAAEHGAKRIIVAGGETSGAVTRALGYNSYAIGQSVAPGVPVMIPSERSDIRLVLKSGNFGQADFFQRALAITGGGTEWKQK